VTARIISSISAARKTAERELRIALEETVGARPVERRVHCYRFTRAPNAADEHHRLSVARHIVELHGGNISAHSAGRNRGSTFTLRLPILRELERRRPAVQHDDEIGAALETSTLSSVAEIPSPKNRSVAKRWQTARFSNKKARLSAG
jgi:hypothetical protein